MPRPPKPGKRTRTTAHALRVSRAFGARLKFVRSEKEIGQDAFAELLGVSRTTASNIERGAQRVFLDQVFRASEILGVPISDLLQVEVLPKSDVVRVAADDPLTEAQERRLTEIVREITVTSRSKKGRV